MKVAHLLRKYDPAQWGGTETALKQLLDGMSHYGVTPTIYSPKIPKNSGRDPLREAGYQVNGFEAFLPVFGIPRRQRQQLISVGGNLLSFTLPWSLWRAPGLSLIHTHTLGRLGGTAMQVARKRKLPFVVTIHGGVLDLPEAVKQKLLEPLRGGFEWGKAFGALVKSRRVIEDADAVVTCNEREASLLREKYPALRVVVQPHGVPMRAYREDCAASAEEAYPQIRGKRVLLCLGRIDPVKNQRWLVDEAPAILQRHPAAMLVFAGSITDAPYGEALREEVERLGLRQRALFTGSLPPGDPRLLGLLQKAEALVLPSLSETFGLVILEAWAANTAVIASKTSGACALVEDGKNGRLFDIATPGTLHAAIDEVLLNPGKRAEFARAGHELVEMQYDSDALAARMKNLYSELIEEARK